MKVIGYTNGGSIICLFDGQQNETFVPDDMANRHRQMIAEWEAAGNTIPPYTSPPPPTNYTISKATPWKRMSEEEANKVAAAMTAASPRLREIYNGAQYLSTTDELWPTLVELVSEAISPKRAKEVLSRET